MDIIEKLLRKWREREQGDDNADAFVDSIMPEVAAWFVSLFKGENSEGIIDRINGLILAIYTMAPDLLQFLFRYVVNVGLEKVQKRWPVWASTPLLVFFRGYLDALEKASKGKAKLTRTPASERPP